MKRTGSEWTHESKSILYWNKKPCRASRNLAHTTDLLAYIWALCTRFVTTWVVTRFLGIVNLTWKTSEIIDVIKKIFATKSLRLKNAMFSVLDGTSAMSGCFWTLINCRNHCLTVCLTHLIKDLDTGELLSDYNNTFITFRSLENVSLFTKKWTKLEAFQLIHRKKPLKIIKAVVRRWQ